MNASFRSVVTLGIYKAYAHKLLLHGPDAFRFPVTEMAPTCVHANVDGLVSVMHSFPLKVYSTLPCLQMNLETLLSAEGKAFCVCFV